MTRKETERYWIWCTQHQSQIQKTAICEIGRCSFWTPTWKWKRDVLLYLNEHWPFVEIRYMRHQDLQI